MCPQLLLSLALLLGLSSLSLAEPLKSGNEGRFCPREAKGYFGIGLLRQQQLFLATEERLNTKALMILRYRSNDEECGEVLDKIVVSASERNFEFSCSDPAHPELIVVGEIASSRPWKTISTMRVWRIDLAQRKILPYARRVTCQNVSYAGADDGEDLVSWARKRAPAK